MYKISKRVISIDISSMETLSRLEGLTKNDYKLLLFLMSRLDSMNLTRLDKKKIAETLEMKKGEVSESLDNLIHSYILYKGTDDHVDKGYKFLL